MNEGPRPRRALRRLPAAFWLLALLAAPVSIRAEEPVQESDRLPGYAALNVSLGVGLTGAAGRNDTTVEGSGRGFYGDVEYVLRPTSWFSPRVYTGLTLTFPQADCGVQVRPCDVSGQFVFGGAKARLMIPIPWVAPFVELGLGVSLGRFSTRSGLLRDQRTNGFAIHVPVNLGIAFGERRQFELAALLLEHPGQGQFSGAWGVGFQFDVP